ncbi:MAG TPA: hypothetical protein DCS07_00555 [Bdellovibrionales bacterium]|nr:MAG: hypothetical protein A2Z97_10095 [Bdellovibrionales bacterium GWB1_52_6]OFZ05268.1 MAG: hypothetical protein A2X97_10805 [Bdellovibrionales bacterium GWA1_52_35]OFZ42794.1 MAG: hypothetical protein A2070_07785 [Bdellovibrionales bacterium GWC1_52_8]HAR41121.1 hypothetical protein [Bdellovibrionales bacterium]HCM38594.1 hypothetical protein [Bdellovibrionales bacterium]
MKIHFLSDLHIEGVSDPLYKILLNLLRDHLQPGDVLVLAGDIFDLFIGSKESFSREYSEFLEALREVGVRGAVTHYIEGNHDFLMKQTFRGMKNVHVHSSELQLEVAGRKIYVAHGDLVDREDYGYRLLRGAFRSLALKAAIEVMPEKLVGFIGKKSSSYGKVRKPILSDQLSPSRRKRLRRIFHAFAEEKISEGYALVVLGHCHDLDEQEIESAVNTGHYYNLGYPRIHKSYLLWDVDAGAAPHREPLGG